MVEAALSMNLSPNLCGNIVGNISSAMTKTKSSGELIMSAAALNLIFLPAYTVMLLVASALSRQRQVVHKTEDRSHNDGILVGEVQEYVPLAAEKREAIVDMHAGARNGEIAFQRPSNDGMGHCP